MFGVFLFFFKEWVAVLQQGGPNASWNLLYKAARDPQKNAAGNDYGMRYRPYWRSAAKRLPFLACAQTTKHKQTKTKQNKTNKQTHKHTNTQTNEQTSERTNEQASKQTRKHARNQGVCFFMCSGGGAADEKI